MRSGHALRRRPLAAATALAGFPTRLVAASLVFLALAAAFVFFVLPSASSVLPPFARRRRRRRGRPRCRRPSRGTCSSWPRPSAISSNCDRRGVAARCARAACRRPMGRRGLRAWQARAGDADAAFGRRDYADALARLRAAMPISSRAGSRRTSRSGRRSPQVQPPLRPVTQWPRRREFERVLAIEPGNAIATRGLERAGSLARGPSVARRGGRVRAAGPSRGRRGQLPQGTAARPGTPRPHARRWARLEAQAASGAFAAAMSQGLDSLARRDYARARDAFERAGRLRPGAPRSRKVSPKSSAALPGRPSPLTWCGPGRRASGALGRRRSPSTARRWRSIATCSRATGRRGARAACHAGRELASFIERPERLYSAEIRGAARATLQRARAVPAPGPLLTGQIEAVDRLVAAAETPLRVALASDNVTDVTIYRFGRLGSFERKDVELLPGRTTVVGVRAGFRTCVARST